MGSVAGMVKITKIYTRTGDDGTTGLVTGARVSKADLRVEAYGTVDEANATIGLVVSSLRTGGILGNQATADRLIDLLTMIQHDLFDLGADLATPDEVQGALRIVQEQIDRLEAEIDEWNADLGPLTSFVLPGGSPAASALHLARTVTRRAERVVVSLFTMESVVGSQSAVGSADGKVIGDHPCLRYLNRLSDLLFVLCRIANDMGRADVLWVPGRNRTPASKDGSHP